MARFLWTQRQDIGPSPSAHSGIAYDTVRRLTYLFGGAAAPQGNWSVYRDTWAWDGRYWTQVARFGPSARLGHTMTFDAARANTVVFGGEPAAGDAFRDSWVFDAVEWTQVEDIGPSPRTRHAAAYDSARQRVVLFGGRQIMGGTTTLVNDTWEWDGQSWTQVEADGPSPRSDHVMAFDSIRNRTILFGGAASPTTATDRRSFSSVVNRTIPAATSWVTPGRQPVFLMPFRVVPAPRISPFRRPWWASTRVRASPSNSTSPCRCRPFPTRSSCWQGVGRWHSLAAHWCLQASPTPTCSSLLRPSQPLRSR